MIKRPLRAPYAFAADTSGLAGANANSAGMWWQGSSYWLDLANGYGMWGGAPTVLSSLITDTHAQTIEANDTTGLYSAFTANTLVRTDLGLQTVPTRTNSLRNNSNTGAVVGSPGTGPTGWAFTNAGLTRSIVGFGTAFGVPYQDIRWNGTTTGVQFFIILGAVTDTAAVNGQTWTNSVVGAELVGGSTTNVTSVAVGWNIYDSGSVYLGTPGNTALTLTAAGATPVRASSTATIANASTAYVAPSFVVQVNNTSAVDITIRIYCPQFEQGSFASPPILTTNAAVTVNGNQQVISGLSSQLAEGVGGVVQVNIRQPSATGTFVRQLSFNDGTGNNAIELLHNGGVISFDVTAGGVNQGSINMPAFAAGVHTYAFAATTNYMIAREVGAALPSADTSVTYPSTSTVNFGGVGYSVSGNTFQNTTKLALFPGPQDAGTFAALFAKAQLAAVQ